MLSELCVRRPVFATMLVMSLVVLGLFSFRDLGVDLFPRADPATVNVSLALPGASPDEISSSVIEPMEEAISGVSGIDEISARISEGKGNVTVRFVLERDLNDAVNDVREKVAGAIKSVPPELLPPVITKVDPDAAPVMSIMVSSDAMSLRTLTELADKQISRSIQTANGVGQVTIAGTRSREIHIVVDIEKLNSYGLSLTQVRDAIVAENVEIPGGAVEQGKGQLLLRTLGRIDAADDFNNVVVATKNGTPIRVSDIGYAEDSFERPQSSVWYGDKPAVLLDIRRAMGENTVAVIEGVRSRLQSIERTLPKSVKLTAGVTSVKATVDFWDDQIDVYRVYLHKGKRLKLTLDGPAGATSNLLLWKPGTKSVNDLRKQNFRVAQSIGPGSSHRLGYRAPSKGWYYVEVKLVTRGSGPYELTLSRS